MNLITKIYIDDEGYKTLIKAKPESDSGFFIGFDFRQLQDIYEFENPHLINNRLFDSGFRHLEDWHKAGIHQVLVSSLVAYEKMSKRDAKVLAFNIISHVRGL